MLPREDFPLPPTLAESRARCSGERPRFWSSAPVLRGSPLGAVHTERLSVPSGSPHRAPRHLPGPQQHPTAVREPRESEGERRVRVPALSLLPGLPARVGHAHTNASENVSLALLTASS